MGGQGRPLGVSGWGCGPQPDDTFLPTVAGGQGLSAPGLGLCVVPSVHEHQHKGSALWSSNVSALQHEHVVAVA